MTELEKVQIDMKLEVVVLGVSDVDRAKAFYEKLGWRLDAGRARAADRASRRLLADCHCGCGQGITSDLRLVRARPVSWAIRLDPEILGIFQSLPAA
jgi:hypothetical protein